MADPSNPGPPGSQFAYRSRHRRASDLAAHESGGGAKLPPVLSDPLVPDGEPELIEQQASLDRLIEQLREFGRFGYDTEFIGEQTYHPWLCLIQVATPSQVWLIDPLAGLDLDGFWRLLADPEVEVLVHAGHQDLEPVVRLVGEPPRGIFDTQVVAGFAGLRYPISLDKLVEELTGADLGHGAKFSQWDRRPLTRLQLGYAANDVRYLALLRDRLLQQLQQLDNWEQAVAANEELTDPARYRPDPANRKVKGKGLHKLSAQKQTVLRSLVVWREHTAIAANVPPRSLLTDQLLGDLAMATPSSLDALSRFKGLPKPVFQSHGQAILDTIREGLEAKATAAPRYSRQQRTAASQIVDTAWAQIEQRCEERGIDPGVVTSKKQLTGLILADLGGRDPDHPAVNRGYRQGLIGDIVDEARAAATQPAS